ncbi:YbbR-like domain-containing protein [Evansella tamaricis]|uniref:YbbR-like domain-containing protein n=1 Tax=Evansella tamaricis TaxID=2069301 RepID=A0ABS6JAL4_9BACI|nr:CdaR family protein [Evansella tamaricis]MBU9710727.1 YbbR-like domain-containing protein [Evansella tamaricis]
MDKWFNNPWFIKGISVVIAILLFLMVNYENVNNQPGGIPGISSTSRELVDVPLTVYYDEDRHVLTEAPETVQVTVRGPNNILNQFRYARQNYEIFVDLREKEAGTHYERVQYRDFPNGITVTVSPSTVRVITQEKQTVSFPVDVELTNQGAIEDGYTVGTPQATPSSVDITAAQGLVEQIATVRASVDVTGRNATFQETASVTVLDQSGNVLNLNPDPPAVEVTVPITSPNKEVPLRIEREGTLPEGMAIENITSEPGVVTIYGPVDVINDISFIDGIKINLSDITGDDVIEIPVPVPNGVERVEPETILVTVDVSQEETREFSEVPIDVTGLQEGRSYTFLEPDDGVVNLVLMGSPGVLGRIERGEFQLYVDLEGLGDGEHEVPLLFNGPQNVRAEGLPSISILIYDSDSEDEREEIIEDDQSGDTS